jgi:hypothetical protein
MAAIMVLRSKNCTSSFLPVSSTFLITSLNNANYLLFPVQSYKHMLNYNLQYTNCGCKNFKQLFIYEAYSTAEKIRIKNKKKEAIVLLNLHEK